MYSKIPMPHLELDEKDMKYVMGFFPLIGLITGALAYGWIYAGEILYVPDISRTLVLIILPVIITGGIHVDGYMDTCDALNSYGDREKKLAILKDSHIGAFAVIKLLVYYVLYFAAAFIVVQKAGNMQIIIMVFTFYLSRIISGLAAVNFRGANGMLHTFTSVTATKRVNIMLVIQLVLCVSCMCMCSIITAIVVVIIAFLVLLYYRHMAYKQFGGVTGDLAGYLLCVSELCMTAAIAVITLI
mgnify:CR=1 FL=1